MFELRENVAAVAIEPQVFSLLLYLIQHADQVVSKEELINEIWNGRAISDTTLSSRIFALRKAVGDTGEEQAIIRTVPRRGFRFVADFTTDDPPAIAETTTPITSRPAPAAATVHPILVVLPFQNASPATEQHFCDGLTEDIIANLTHFSEVRVIASSTSFRFKNLNLSHAEIAAETGAVYIVEGSVRHEGNRMRIAVQLIEAATGISLWADRYDRLVEDIFAVQDAVTHMVVASLGVKMQSAELTRALGKSPSDLSAYECLLHARRYTATMNEDMHADARSLLEKAIQLDPNYAEAHALLANVYLAEHRIDANPLPNSVGRALAMALKAVQLDPQSAYAHCWLAIVHFFQKDFAKFEAEMQRALALNPHDPEILAEAGHYYAFNGEFDRGVEFARRARELNPLHPGWYHFAYALLHLHQRRYEEMMTDVQRISMPNIFWPHMLDAAALGQLGRIGEAKAALALMHETKPGVSPATELKKWNVPPADFEHMMDGLRKAGYKE
ncbi:MAG: winged helix-turn-helix domain-containing tetratricopeptide repeat protein [Pikeienuella sp.]